ncbi:MAG: CPBP family intramembrane metalloprotease, partial [Parvularculaceae bacterium]|nr:CPBP family intramembrane metalloprotease [Parvularculaceae bacterium]
ARGVRALISRAWRPAHLAWFVAGALITPAVAIAVALVSGNAPKPFVLSLAAAQVVLWAPIGEEFGWRAFMLPRLLEAAGPWTATALVALAWSVWHAPAFFIDGMMAAAPGAFGWWALSTFGLSAAMTALHLRADGNLFACGLLPHASVNALGVVGLWSATPAQSAALALVGGAMLALAASAERGTGRR